LGKGRLAKAGLRMPRLTRRVLVGTVAASAALGGGTAGALMSIGHTPTHAAPARTAHALSQPPVSIDPGGPIVVAPDPSPPSTPPPLPSPATPPVRSTPPTPPPPPIGAAALSQISYPWQQLGYQIVFLGPRADLMGQTIFDQHRIEIYLRNGESRLMVAHVVAHEIGHAADVAYNTPERRQRWLQLRGASTSQPWFGCDGCDDFSSPAGDYAETFSFWQVGPAADYSHLAPHPSADQLKQLIPLFYGSSSSSSGGSAGPPPSSPSSPPSSGGSGPPPGSGSQPGQSCLTVVCSSRG
ncbi:MAG TPA: hypothetical protein VGL32_11320, partial [Acidimicrobiales bacterium]